MKSKLFFSIVFVLLSGLISAQKGTITGTVSDKYTGELLVGVSIIYAPGKGVMTDVNGKYSLELPYGDYTLSFMYVGYNKVEKKVSLKEPEIKLDIKLTNATLKEVEIVADVAKARETPVAFSTIKPAKLEEQLAGQDLPMILNSTPGVYATQQGGGDGDARINIRGFNQRNIAVMLDGIPVNDMENGWVYWSNWFGLDIVTRSIQVQRGLGASKLALPSVGGTMNIITKGIEAKKGLKLKQEVGSNGYLRTSIGLTTGRMKNGWGITAAGSYKRGNGWVDMTWTKGWFYYLRVDKKAGNHLLSFSAMGAPQSHGQRAYKKPIYTYDTAYATSVGIEKSDYIPGIPLDQGLRYNGHWGYLTRTDEGETDSVKMNEKVNFYYKPMFSLRDYWNVSEKVYMSTIAYLSLGDGGGTGLTHSTGYRPDGTYDIQSVYNANLQSNANDKPTSDILRASMNNHFWVGVLNTTDYKISKQWNISGGIDLRYYKGEHYRTAYDMLGAKEYNDRSKRGSALMPNDLTNPVYLKGEGEKILYHNDGLVSWGGLFAQAKYKTGNWSAFVNITGAYTGYKRIDYFKKKDLVIDGQVYSQAVGYDSLKYDPSIRDFVYLPKVVKINGKEYTVNSPEARTAQTEWKWIPSFTLKGGVNYNLTETQNVYVNVGLLNKAPRFRNVYDNNNRLYQDIRNEKVYAFEAGYGVYNKHFTLNVNTYITQWKNKPADRAYTYRTADEITYSVNINGMDALHMGLETEFGWRMTKDLMWKTVISLGDWKWQSSDSAIVTDENTGDEVGKIYFNAKGLYVGDAAQTQLRQSLRWQVPWKALKGLYVEGAVTYFGKNYSNFDPLTLDPSKYPNSFDDNGNPIQSWRIPDFYLVDLYAGYYFKIKNSRLKFNVSILNLFNKEYISDAQNNDQYSGQTSNSSDARSASVFFGLGRRFMTSLTFSI